MANIKFYLSRKTPIEGQAEVLVRFYCAKGCDFKSRTRIFVPTDKWDATRGELAFNARYVSKSINVLIERKRALDALKSRIMEEYAANPYAANNTKWLRSVIDAFHNPQPTTRGRLLADICEEYADTQDISVSTADQYRVIQRMLLRYGEYDEPLYCNEVVSEDIEDFAEYLRFEKVVNRFGNEQSISRGQNTISTKLKKLRAVCNYAVRKGYMESNPFNGYRIPMEQYGTPIFLTIEERDRVADYWLESSALSTQRDIFIFQCHIGCRVSDLFSLTSANIDNGFVVYVQQKLKKQGKTIRVPLDDTAAAIVRAYEGGDTLLPFISETHYNEAIREILRLVGIDRSVMVLNTHSGEYEAKPLYETASSHLARRTFAANMFKATKSERITAAFTGHAEGSRAFGRYTEVDDEMKISVLRDMREKAEEKPTE